MLTLKAKCFHQRIRSKVRQATPLKIGDMDVEKCHKIQRSWSHNSGTTSQRKKWFVGLALKGEWGLTPGWICWAFFFNYVKLSCILLRTTSDMLLKKYVFFLYYNITSERMPYLNWRYFLFKRRDEGSVIFRYVRRDMLYREPLPFGRTLDSAICLIIHQECTNCGHRCKSTLAKNKHEAHICYV